MYTTTHAHNQAATFITMQGAERDVANFPNFDWRIVPDVVRGCLRGFRAMTGSPAGTVFLTEEE